MEIDFTQLKDEWVLDETEQHEDEPSWLPDLRRSINGLHFSLAALHRKAGQMSATVDALVASVTELENKEGLLETAVAGVATAVSGAAVAFTVLDAHIEALVGGGALTEEQGAALKDRTDALGSKLGEVATNLGNAATSLAGDAAAAETAGGADGTSAGGGGGTPAVARNAEGKPLYNFTGDPANIKAEEWPKDGAEQGAGGVALFTFLHDTPGGDPTGPVVVGGGEGWTIWTGPTESVPAG